MDYIINDDAKVPCSHCSKHFFLCVTAAAMKPAKRGHSVILIYSLLYFVKQLGSYEC